MYHKLLNFISLYKVKFSKNKLERDTLSLLFFYLLVESGSSNFMGQFLWERTLLRPLDVKSLVRIVDLVLSRWRRYFISFIFIYDSEYIFYSF